MRLTLLNFVVLGIIGCGTQPAANTTNTNVAISELIVPGERVGEYVINTSTLSEILGSDSTEARNRFARKGLVFQFEKGRELKGVTVHTSSFQLKNGLKVGSKMADVEALMGKPMSRNIAGGKFVFDALVYPGITFVSDDGRVAAIRVGGSER